MPTIEVRVKDIIAHEMGIDVKDIDAETVLTDDLGADSLDLIELTMAIEEEFQGEIPDEDAKQILTVGQIVEYVEKKVAEAKASNSREWRG